MKSISKKNNIHFSKILIMLASSSCLISNAVDAVDFGGYFRIGPGASEQDASRACYGLDGPGLKYRLGNECDVYAEFQLSESFSADNIDYKVVLMNNFFTPQSSNIEDTKVGTNQLYMQGKGFDIAPNTSFWIGERFYGRAEVHIVDTKFTRLDGTGAGAEIPIGKSNLGLAFFKDDQNSTVSGSRINIDYSNIPLTGNGSLRFVGTVTKANFSNGEDGYGLTMQHTQKNFLGWGGNNDLWIQYADGSSGLDGNFGDLSLSGDSSSWRVAESFTWQKGAFGGQFLAMFQNDEDNNGDKTESISLGGRISYAITNNFKLVSELGYSEKSPDNSDKQELTKFTIAPTLSVGPDFWSRPEFRFYITSAKWNDAANNAAVGGVTGLNDGATDGTSYGFQVEYWF